MLDRKKVKNIGLDFSGKPGTGDPVVAIDNRLIRMKLTDTTHPWQVM